MPPSYLFGGMKWLRLWGFKRYTFAIEFRFKLAAESYRVKYLHQKLHNSDQYRFYFQISEPKSGEVTLWLSVQVSISLPIRITGTGHEARNRNPKQVSEPQEPVRQRLAEPFEVGESSREERHQLSLQLGVGVPEHFGGRIAAVVAAAAESRPGLWRC